MSAISTETPKLSSSNIHVTMTEKKLWTVRTDDDEENDTFSSYVALDDVNVFEAAPYWRTSI